MPSHVEHYIQNINYLCPKEMDGFVLVVAAEECKACFGPIEVSKAVRLLPTCCRRITQLAGCKGFSRLQIVVLSWETQLMFFGEQCLFLNLIL